ncbi:hypothetical protein ACS7SF_02700 [Ralstonia sp. 25C]|uniref:hypothetical protein n=1 Tax=Ralstonia sp. 25C TaxID=3447363 RepID=UPI003F755D74
MKDQCLFEIRQRGVAVAAVTGPRADAVCEALRCALKYEQDGAVEVVELLTLYTTPDAGSANG